MKIHDKYDYFNRGYIMLPLELPTDGLHNEITLFGDIYELKKEFHVSLLCTKMLLQEYSINEKDSVSFFTDFTLSHSLVDIKYLPEYRLVSHPDGRKSIIQLVEIKNNKLFFGELSRKFNVEISEEPKHITIYVLRGQNGIGVNTKEQMEKTMRLQFK